MRPLWNKASIGFANTATNGTQVFLNGNFIRMQSAFLRIELDILAKKGISFTTRLVF